MCYIFDNIVASHQVRCWSDVPSLLLKKAVAEVTVGNSI